MKRPILGVVLWGGKSTRMGQDKGKVEVRPGVSQVTYASQLLELVCEEVVWSVGPVGSERGVDASHRELLFDAEGVGGPMGGVLAALERAEGRAVLVLACDMPFVEASHLVQLVNRRRADVLATVFAGEGGGPEPLCAIYEPACCELLRECSRQGRLSLRRFLNEVEVEKVQPASGEFLASVNDPESLKQARGRFS